MSTISHKKFPLQPFALFSFSYKILNIDHRHKHTYLNLIYILLLFGRMEKCELLSAAQPPGQPPSYAGFTFCGPQLSQILYSHSALDSV